MRVPSNLIKNYLRMKTYKFSAENNEFITELRKEVKEYFTKNKLQQYGNYRIIIKSVVMTVLYFVPYGLMVSGLVPSVSMSLLAWFLMGIGMAGLGMVTMHDANHNSFSGNKNVNRWVGKSLYLLGGFPPNWRFQHNTLHHGYTNIDGQDEDIAHVGVLRFSPHQPLKGVHKYQYLYAWLLYSLMTISWITAKDFKRFSQYKSQQAPLSDKSYNQLFTELLLSKVVYYTLFLILPLIIIPFAWYWILAGFLLMHLTGGFILTIIFQTAHVVPSSEYPLPDGEGRMDNSWAIHQLHTTADFAPDSKILSWYIGGLNYQIEHHLFPNISHVHYKAISGLVQKAAQKHGVPYYINKSFLKALVEHGRMLKQLGRMDLSRAQVQVGLVV